MSIIFRVSEQRGPQEQPHAGVRVRRSLQEASAWSLKSVLFFWGPFVIIPFRWAAVFRQSRLSLTGSQESPLPKPWNPGQYPVAKTAVAISCGSSSGQSFFFMNSYASLQQQVNKLEFQSRRGSEFSGRASSTPASLRVCCSPCPPNPANSTSTTLNCQLQAFCLSALKSKSARQECKADDGGHGTHNAGLIAAQLLSRNGRRSGAWASLSSAFCRIRVHGVFRSGTAVPGMTALNVTQSSTATPSDLSHSHTTFSIARGLQSVCGFPAELVM